VLDLKSVRYTEFRHHLRTLKYTLTKLLTLHIAKIPVLINTVRDLINKSRKIIDNFPFFIYLFFKTLFQNFWVGL
jgi:hypothetical protein